MDNEGYPEVFELEKIEQWDYSLNSDKCLIAFDYTIEIKVEKDCYVYECN